MLSLYFPLVMQYVFKQSPACWPLACPLQPLYYMAVNRIIMKRVFYPVLVCVRVHVHMPGHKKTEIGQSRAVSIVGLDMDSTCLGGYPDERLYFTM